VTIKLLYGIVSI